MDCKDPLYYYWDAKADGAYQAAYLVQLLKSFNQGYLSACKGS